MGERTNMPELLNRFMETSNIAIKPPETRLHRLIILRFFYSFGQSSDVSTCIQRILESGVDVGLYNKQTTEVSGPTPSLPLGCRVCCKGSVFQVVTLNGVCVGTQTGLSHNLTSMQISEWIELIQLLHIESFEAIVAELRDRYQENIRNSSPVLIILNTLQVVQSVCLQGIELFGIVLTACMACAAK